jgi:threonine dehydratase
VVTGDVRHAELRLFCSAALIRVRTSRVEGGLGAANHHSFRLVHALLDEALLVDEAAIAGAMRWARDELDLVVKGGGAVTLAALRSDAWAGWGQRVAAIVSGGNVDPTVLAGL